MTRSTIAVMPIDSDPRDERPARRPGLVRRLLAGRRAGYAWTFGLQLLSIVLSVAAFKLAADYFGGAGFGEYALARRALSLVTFPLLLGLGTSIPRFTTQHRAGGGAPGPGSYALAGLIIATPTFAVAAGLIAGAPGLFARLVFGDSAYAWLTLPTLSAIFGLYLHMLAYGLLVGQFRTGAASLLQVVNVAVAPVMAIVLCGGDVARSLTWLGVTTAGLSAAVGGWAAFAMGVREVGGSIGRPIRDLLGFGLPRVPGEIALFGLFGAPAFVMARRAGVEAAGLLSFGISLVQLLGAVFAAGAVLLLPMTGRMLAEGQHARIGPLVNRVIGLALLASVAVVAAAEVVLGPLVAAWLGPTLAAAADASRWTLVATIPYVAFVVLRGPLDALEVWPHNSINLGVALAVEILLLALPSSLSPSLAFLVSLGILGCLTALSWLRCVAHIARAASQ